MQKIYEIIKGQRQKAFIRFLKENEVYVEFKKEIENCTDEDFIYSSMKDLLENENPYNYIAEAFYWQSSKRGQHFWGVLDDKLHEILNGI